MKQAPHPSTTQSGTALGHRMASRWRRLACLGLLLTASAGTPAAEWLGSGDCQVRLLHPSDEDQLPSSYAGKVKQPESEHRMVVKEALALMPPLTCAAVQRIVFVRTMKGHVDEEGWVSNSLPDLVNINLDVSDPQRLADEKMGAYYTVKTMQAILHESTHAADFLLHAHGAEAGLLGSLAGSEHYKQNMTTANPDPEMWPAAARSLARQAVTDNRLGGSLRAEWIRIQDAFWAFGLGGDYRGPKGPDEPTADASLAKDGFTSRYGATRAGEDIAEFAAWMLATPLLVREWDGRVMPAIAVDDLACRRMRTHDKTSVPAELALLYTKATLLYSTGLVTQEAYDRCVGKLRLEQPGEGVFVWEFIGEPKDDNIQLKRNFNNNVKLSIGTHPQRQQYVFQLEAGGTSSYRDVEIPSAVRIRLALAPADRELELVSWPRGIYDLAAFGNRFALEVDDTPSASFFATKALLLVTHASNQRIEGSIFLQQALRSSTPPVPQTGLPMRFTFSVKK